jgi:hypothetical protein
MLCSLACNTFKNVLVSTSLALFPLIFKKIYVLMEAFEILWVLILHAGYTSIFREIGWDGMD